MAKLITLDNLTYYDSLLKPWVTGQGYQTATQVGAIVDGRGYQTATQVSQSIQNATANLATDAELSEATAGMATQTWVGQQGYQTSANVEQAIASKGFATTSSVTSAVNAAKSDLQQQISSAVSSVYTPMGSTAFSSLPSPSSSIVGDVYNVTDAFTTTSSFVEGAGSSYPAGTNVVCVSDSGAYKWDVLAGMVDLSDYLTQSDLVPVTDDEIDAMFN